MLATCGKATVTFRPSGVRPSAVVPGGGFCPPVAFPTVGVGHPASHATLPSSAFAGTSAPLDVPSLWSRVVGVGHGAIIEALSDVRSAEARSATIFRFDGVSRTFKVSRYNVEPTEAIL
jgi:hypothetical protein